ncbi:MAG: hypothetical protein ACK5U8_23005, partial [Deltaproteobacteria bacterium]
RAAPPAHAAARAPARRPPLRAPHPDHAPLRAHLAASAAAGGQSTLAREAALESIWLNPCDPEPHCALAAVAEDAALAALASAECGD